jgi:hypothetical protein
MLVCQRRKDIADHLVVGLIFDKQSKLVSASIKAVLDAKRDQPQTSGLIFCKDKPYKSREDLMSKKNEYPNSPNSSHQRERSVPELVLHALKFWP